jgi:AP-1 complex subunit mu
MASSLYCLDSKGAPLISRAYRGDVQIDVPSTFARRVLDEEEFNISPVFEDNGHTFVYIRFNDVVFLTVSRVNCSPLTQIAFLRRMVSVFESYMGHVSEESVRDNFVIIYELLDEVMDFGYPQYTEEKVLKEYITQEGLIQLFDEEELNVKALPSAVTGIGGATPWRLPGIKYRKNEVFLDVVESINLLVGQDGETLSSEIIGALKMKVQLSGMPDLKLGLNDKVFFETSGKRPAGKTVELEDIKFHQCVKLNRFESDRVITFVPPDGDFELMTYRLNTKIKPLIHVEAIITRHGTSRVEMQLKARSTCKKSSTATFVDIHIPVPVDVDKPEAKANNGTVKYVPEKSTLLWSIKNFPGGKEFVCKCQYTVPSVRASDPSVFSKVPINVKFEIPYFTASGFQVRYLKVTETKANYEALPWVRYVTQSGDYQIRTN